MPAPCPRSLDLPGGSPQRRGAPALFLDRDGVINEDHGYTHRREDFHFLPGVFELGRAAVAKGYRLIVVTNQAGIGRGLYDEAALRTLSHWMGERFAAEGAPIDRLYFCPHHPEAALAGYRLHCLCRKPQPGMLQAAAGELGVDLAGSLLVGDKASDLQAGAAAGVGALVLLGSDSLPGELAGARRVQALADVPALLG